MKLSKALLFTMFVVATPIWGNYVTYYTSVGGPAATIDFFDGEKVFLGSYQGFMLWQKANDGGIVSYTLVNNLGDANSRGYNRFVRLSDDTILVFNNTYASYVDVSDWTYPRVVSTVHYNTGQDTVEKFTYAGGYLFIAVQKGTPIFADLLRIYDVRDMSPVFTYAPEGDRAITMLDVYRDTVLIVMENDSLKLFSISFLPDSLHLISALRYDHGLWGGALVEDSARIFVTTHWDHVIAVIDISDLQNPQVVASQFFPSYSFEDMSIHALGDDSLTYLIVRARDYPEFYLFDASDINSISDIDVFSDPSLTAWNARYGERKALFVESEPGGRVTFAYTLKSLPQPPYMEFQEYRYVFGSRIGKMVVCRQPRAEYPDDTVITVVAFDEEGFLRAYRTDESSRLLEIQTVQLAGDPISIFHKSDEENREFALVVVNFGTDSCGIQIFEQDNAGGGRMNEVSRIKLGDYTAVGNELIGSATVDAGVAWDEERSLLFVNPYLGISDSMVYMYRIDFSSHPVSLTLIDSAFHTPRVGLDPGCGVRVSQNGFVEDGIGNSYLLTGSGPAKIRYDENGFDAPICLKDTFPSVPVRYAINNSISTPSSNQYGYFLLHVFLHDMWGIVDSMRDETVWETLTYMMPNFWISWLRNDSSGICRLAPVYDNNMEFSHWECSDEDNYVFDQFAGGGPILMYGDDVFFVGSMPFWGRPTYGGIVILKDTTRQSVSEPIENSGSAVPSGLMATLTDRGITVFYQSTRSEDAELRIYRIDGRLVRSQDVRLRTGMNELTMDMPQGLPNGIYIVRLRHADGVKAVGTKVLWLRR